MKKDYDSTRIYRNTQKRVRHRLMTHPQVSLEMKEQQSEDVAISVSDEKKDAKDMEQSASSDYSEQTEAEEEKVARSAFRR